MLQPGLKNAVFFWFFWVGGGGGGVGWGGMEEGGLKLSFCELDRIWFQRNM